MEHVKANEKTYTRLIWAFSIIVPLVVAVLINPRMEIGLSLGFNPYILPKINAYINSVVAILLVLGFVFIRRRQIDYHRMCMLGAFGLSAIFLILYILYHLSAGHTSYCGEGGIRTLYLTLLFSHIVLSAGIVPLASFSVFRALSERYDKHRKIAKITLPIWLYVAVTGVVVYWMIAPCYGA